MATRATLRNQLRRFFRDEDASKFTDEIIHDAIDFAIDEAWPWWFELMEDNTTITIATDTFSYALPSDCEELLQVHLERTSNEPYAPRVDWWWYQDTSSTGTVTKYLYLPQSNSYEDGKVIRLVYTAKPHNLASDTDSTTLPSPYVMAQAKVYLCEAMITMGPGKDVDHWKMLMSWNMQRADDIRNNMRQQRPPGHVHFREWDPAIDIYAQPSIIDKRRPG
jgi:hypothetical protein